MTLKDWEDKRDRLADRLRSDYLQRSNARSTSISDNEWKAEATAALEFLGMPRPVEEKWCEHFTNTGKRFVMQSGGQVLVDNDWKCCPVCSKPRPGTESKPIELPPKFDEATAALELLGMPRPVEEK